MKLTWFGGTTIRIHIGGSILVVDADGAPEMVNAVELVSGADEVIQSFGGSLEAVDTGAWKPRRPMRLLDENDSVPAVDFWQAAPGMILVDAIGEPALVLTDKFDLPRFGRWAERAVFVLFGTELRERAESLRDDVLPKLIVLAGSDEDVDQAFQLYAEQMSDTGLISLEAGLALEV